MLQTPVANSDPSCICENDLVQMRTFIERKKLEVLAATQLGIEERLIIGYIDDTLVSMVNPRILDYDEEDYVYMKVPAIHTSVDFTDRYWNNITLGWDWVGATKYPQKCEMYGIQAAMFQQALNFLDGQPPWKYKKMVDW